MHTPVLFLFMLLYCIYALMHISCSLARFMLIFIHAHAPLLFFYSNISCSSTVFLLSYFMLLYSISILIFMLPGCIIYAGIFLVHLLHLCSSIQCSSAVLMLFYFMLLYCIIAPLFHAPHLDILLYFMPLYCIYAPMFHCPLLYFAS